MKQTGIEYVDSTWNPVRGCKWKSDGCTNCWAERIAGRYAKKPGDTYFSVARLNRAGEPKWNGEVDWVIEKFWDPLDWLEKETRRIMVCSMSDLFYPKISHIRRDQIFGLMALCGEHTFLVQTKYAAEMRQYFAEPGVWKRIDKCARQLYKEHWKKEHPSKRHLQGPLGNTWLGVSIENQETADERIPILEDIPAALRYVDAQPLLGLVTLDKYLGNDKLHWVIAGGESGMQGRPCNPMWIRQLKHECNEYRVAFYMHLWGAWMPVTSDQLKEHSAGEDNLFIWPNGEMSVNLHRSDMVSMKKKMEEYGAVLDGEVWKQFPEFEKPTVF
jgi:protein gp37